MAKRALIEHRPWLLAAVAAAVAYYFLRDNQASGGWAIAGTWLILLKGAGVGFLSIYAMRRAPGLDGKLLAFALALSAMADMALEISLIAGGALFAASHAVAIGLYLRNRRERTVMSQRMLAFALVIAAPVISYYLSGRTDIGVYGAVLGAMAAAAWTSRFPRYRVGIGAMLFVVSDWLIFSQEGPLDLGILPDLLIWPLYFIAQVMIATGVTQTLRGERVAN
ncbi:MAG: lysoplasmalogenase family protein [Pseudomonadota bacterium]